MIDTLKNFTKMGTDLFVRLNEEVAEKLNDAKVDEKYTNRLLSFVHHVRDKNEFLMETASFWSAVHKEIENEGITSKVESELTSYHDECESIFNRKSSEKDEAIDNWITGLEKYPDELATKFVEFGTNASGDKKASFQALVEFTKVFQELEGSEDDNGEFEKVWQDFYEEFTKSEEK